MIEQYNKDNPQEHNKPTKGHGCAIAFVFLLAIAITISIFFFFIIKPGNTNDKNYSRPGNIVEALKPGPDITAEQTLTSLLINVHCNASYTLVEVEVSMFDKSGKIIDSTTLQGRNYQNGNTYKLEYKPSLSTMWNTEKYSCVVSKYY